MSEWTWQQAVAEKLLVLVNHSGTPTFTLDQVYEYEASLQEKFPRNRHVRAKVRQTLQRLRDVGLVAFLGDGKYELDLAYEDLESSVESSKDEHSRSPKYSRTVRQVRLRNTILATELKRRYKYRCQICRLTVQLLDRLYAEAHHIRPLGRPHSGRDVEGNILVVCPNHHVMLDRGAIEIDPATFIVSHVCGAFEPRSLHLARWHKLHLPSLTYYGRQICGR
ncbi:MAG: hypothetical protein DWQ31_02625 [Planctomycetota bacterium]|nr:MAG: hypothetical protein DWQ31_02625 [Planctomycetota bacterium]REJ95761.1 MAG: hypothetical protein DWQ35_05770 [Planctomycetota bacterium]REK43471.1 MAG: hypothetical protein DWQ46_11210 [Planctomycetota bacterium]